ncbi:hypothetical protein O7627_13955 [Solwaraspora sp. WMMD1047]|uniref:hypothetical protein n=1 Tax=Solwaraspora sp. WMMD1047 TaxID=3016102 RepID=UPI002417B3E6|nr:hypothetical protein [Solwaraspora sp. WMMD1047]MDG4830404.1 hypothetical protein [Solwaraspora sp. WMMD1047]
MMRTTITGPSAGSRGSTLDPVREAFVEAVRHDDDLMRAEFDALIAANWPTRPPPPPPPALPRPVPRPAGWPATPAPRREPAGRRPRADARPRSRQRSPPPAR